MIERISERTPWLNERRDLATSSRPVHLLDDLMTLAYGFGYSEGKSRS
jgi:hypothetical protein